MRANKYLPTVRNTNAKSGKKSYMDQKFKASKINLILIAKVKMIKS